MKLKPWWKRQWPFLCLPDCYKPFYCPVLVLIVTSLNFTTRSSLSCLSSISMHSFKSYCLSPRSLAFCFSSHPLCKAVLWGQRNMEHRTRKAAVFLLYMTASFSLNPYSAVSNCVSRTDHVKLSLTAFAKVLCLLWHFSSSDDTVLTNKCLSPMGQPKTGSMCAFAPWGPEKSFNFSSFLATCSVFFPLGACERRARAGTNRLK